MVTFETEFAHGELEIVHAKTFTPNPKPVIVVFGKVGFVIVPVPEIKVHAPVPITGVLPVIVVVGDEMQSVCDDPALAVVGAGLTVMVTFETEGAHGELEIVHAKTLFPKPNPVTAVVANNELVITPLPETRVHAPVPEEGKLPFMVVFGLLMQSV